MQVTTPNTLSEPIPPPDYKKVNLITTFVYSICHYTLMYFICNSASTHTLTTSPGITLVAGLRFELRSLGYEPSGVTNSPIPRYGLQSGLEPTFSGVTDPAH